MKNSYRGTSDGPAIGRLAGEHAARYFKQSFELKIKGDVIPEVAVEPLLAELQKLFARHGASAALSAKATIKWFSRPSNFHWPSGPSTHDLSAMKRVLLLLLAFVLPALANEGAGSRFAYLDERDPYYPGLGSAKLTTPMWVGEDGVDAVVQLSIDDMGRLDPAFRLMSYAKSPQFYYQFLQSAIERLQRIDGRAPISIYTLQAQADDPWFQRMLKEGLSIEAHTFTHAVPYFRTDPSAMGGDSLGWCIRDFTDCVAGLSAALGTPPVAWRMPGCDARNTTSPRFYSEIFPRKTSAGDFLAMDSSIFTVLTSADASLPRELVLDAEGRERFGRFVTGIPFTKHFVNCVINYPYPYVINGLLWELPPVMPGDAHGVHAYGMGSPRVLEDWQRALNVTVIKQGLHTICFHPHGYSLPESIAGLVDYADRTYGKRVKFLNCREILERLTKNALAGTPLRSASGADNGVRLLDVNGDGFLDVVIGNSQRQLTRIWQPREKRWRETPLPVALVTDARFFTAAPDGRAGLAIATAQQRGVWHFENNQWIAQKIALPSEADGTALLTARDGVDRGARFRDLNGDGYSDLIVNNDTQNAVFLWDSAASRWQPAPFALPARACVVDANGADQGLRFVDLDADGDDDLVFSNEREYWVRTFEGPDKGWFTLTRSGKAADTNAIPMIARKGELMGVWFHSGKMVQVNEFTANGRADNLVHRDFSELLLPASPKAKSSETP